MARDTADRLMADVHRARIAELGKGPAKGTWPRESLELWRRIAATAGHPARARAREVVATAKAAGW